MIEQGMADKQNSNQVNGTSTESFSVTNNENNSRQNDFALHALEGRRVLEVESRVLADAAEHLNTEQFGAAVEIILGCTSHVVVTGIGKSGHVGRKIAATLASTGTPAFFLHPAEALHGDLGMLTRSNVLLALSNSGGSEELWNLLPYLKRHSIDLIVVTSRPDSRLAQAAQAVLAYPLEKEACPLNLAPTASTVVQMALGDALAVALMTAKGFSEEDFALRHPLGTLGRRLIMRVCDIMLPRSESPILHESVTLGTAIERMVGLGAVALENDSQQLTGIFTNEDLRRLFKAGSFDQTAPITSVMTKKPRTIFEEVLGSKAAEVFEFPKSVSVLPVINKDDKLVGMLHLHHLIQAGVA